MKMGTLILSEIQVNEKTKESGVHKPENMKLKPEYLYASPDIRKGYVKICMLGGMEDSSDPNFRGKDPNFFTKSVRTRWKSKADS